MGDGRGGPPALVSPVRVRRLSAAGSGLVAVPDASCRPVFKFRLLRSSRVREPAVAGSHGPGLTAFAVLLRSNSAFLSVECAVATRSPSIQPHSDRGPSSRVSPRYPSELEE